MPGSFYYTPVDPGYDRGPAAGIVAGIGQAISNINTGIQQRRQQKIQDDERARQHKREDVQDKRAADNFSLEVANLGGGMGQAPTTTRTTEVPIAADPLPQPSYNERPEPQFGRSWLKQNADATLPQMGGPKTIQQTDTVADPRYEQLGDFYIEKPDVRRQRMNMEADDRALNMKKATDAIETQGNIAQNDALYKSKVAEKAAEDAAKEQDRKDTVGRIANALIGKGVSRSQANAEAELMADKTANYGDLHPHYAPSATDPNRVNATSKFSARVEAARDRNRDLANLQKMSLTSTFTPQEMEAARKEIEDRYTDVMKTIDGDGTAAPATTPPVAGQSAAQPQRRTSLFEPASIDSFIATATHSGAPAPPAAAAPAPAAAPAKKPAAAAAPPKGPAPKQATDTIAEARSIVSHLPPDQQKQWLKDAGFADTEIRKILAPSKPKGK